MSTFPKALFQAGPTGSKRGSGAPSARGRMPRGNRPLSRQDNSARDPNAQGGQGNMSGLKHGRGRGTGAIPPGPRGAKASNRMRMESARPSSGVSRGTVNNVIGIENLTF
ncbi:hypothetical protein PRK78_001883 [Emydomyces testavorans]|uniref:Uncharacterized protein n=1 Tax=Emydomyces testavorans TaxID=2070801 RepID=A0AAF0IFY1_9EURO|nr:hypothetical protein PRK78_001883 [Emydomyces testavorans]